jgi:hypothetical protein
MVYNRYHRVLTTAFQKAVRAFGEKRNDFETKMRIAKDIIEGSSLNNTRSLFLQQYRDCPESQLADGLLQPVEYSFTVESLGELAALRAGVSGSLS